MRIAPSSACSASMLCGSVRIGSAGISFRTVESVCAMVPINRFACGRFAVGWGCLSECAATQHLSSLDDAKLPDAKPFLHFVPESGSRKGLTATLVLSIIQQRRDGKSSFWVSPLRTAACRKTRACVPCLLTTSFWPSGTAELFPGESQRGSLSRFQCT